MADHIDLISAARKGNVSAFEQLMAEYLNMVYAVALKIVRSPEDAQDVSQRAFLAAWQGLPTFRGDAAFSTWLYQITRRHALNSVTRSARAICRPLDSERADEGSGPADLAVADDTAVRLRHAVAKLPSPQRDAICLHHFDGLSYGQIAAATGSTVPAVRSHLFRARRSLATTLAAHR